MQLGVTLLGVEEMLFGLFTLLLLLLLILVVSYASVPLLSCLIPVIVVQQVIVESIIHYHVLVLLRHWCNSGAASAELCANKSQALYHAF